MTRRLSGAGLLLLIGSLALAASAHAGPILQEVCYDGDGSDADEVFTEIWGTPGLELDGYSLKGVNGGDGTVYRTISLDDLVIPADGILVLATSGATGAVLAARDATANVDWQNGPDAVQLWGSGNTLLDALQYGDAGDYNAGEGDYATDVAGGWSLSRDGLGSDTDDNATDFSGLSTPTPGVGPSTTTGSSPVPEPASVALVGAAILALVRRRRRRT